MKGVCVVSTPLLLALLLWAVAGEEQGCGQSYEAFFLHDGRGCEDDVLPVATAPQCVKGASYLSLDLVGDIIQTRDATRPWGCYYNPAKRTLWWNSEGGIESNQTLTHTICVQGASVFTWGDNSSGGDSSTVANIIARGVKHIHSNNWAFAALKTNGSVVTWGMAEWGGDSSTVDISADVKEVFATEYAFAAYRTNGSVVTWGTNCSVTASQNCGGDSSSVMHKLREGVVTVRANSYAFAAIKTGGEVVTWGDPESGGDSSSVDLGCCVTSIVATASAFAALRENGTVVSWGNLDGTIPLGDVRDVTGLYATQEAFAAVKNDGGVVTWGSKTDGGNMTTVASQLQSGVVSISSTAKAFAAVKEDGTVVTWGHKANGGDSSTVELRLRGVRRVVANSWAFAALKNAWGGEGNAVVTWGGVRGCCGGDSTTVAGELAGGVAAVHGAESSFAAVTTSGRVISWGSIDPIPPDTAKELEADVETVCASREAYTAIKKDGRAVSWGHGLPANSSSVTDSMCNGVRMVTATYFAFAAGRVGSIDCGQSSASEMWSTAAIAAVAVIAMVAAVCVAIGAYTYLRQRERMGHQVLESVKRRRRRAALEHAQEREEEGKVLREITPGTSYHTNDA